MVSSKKHNKLYIKWQDCKQIADTQVRKYVPGHTLQTLWNLYLSQAVQSCKISMVTSKENRWLVLDANADECNMMPV